MFDPFSLFKQDEYRQHANHVQNDGNENMFVFKQQPIGRSALLLDMDQI